MQSVYRFAIVITHVGAHRRLIDLPWLERDYQIDESDWVVLSDEAWRALVEGDAATWDALEHKLLVGCYLNQPQLIAVVGHPLGGHPSDSSATGQREIGQMVGRIHSLLLPATVCGFWTDEQGALQDIVAPTEATVVSDDGVEIEMVH